MEQSYDGGVVLSQPVEQGDWKLRVPEVSDAQVASLVEEMNRTGFAVINDYADDATLARLRQYVSDTVAAAGGEYVVLTGIDEMRGSLLETIGASQQFQSLMHRIYTIGVKRPLPHQSLFQVLRCLAGRTGLNHSYFFHYDSYAITALLPIVIPESGKRGDLLMKPNRRPVRSWYGANVIDKIFLDNKFWQKHLRGKAVAREGGFAAVPMQPGNLYFFWGYRTIHANEPCDVGAVRSTALFHFGDPHADSWLRGFMGKAKVRAKAQT